MSVDLLSNLGKEVVSKKDTVVDSKKEVSTKKEGSSLFDSLMKDIQKDKENISTSTSQQKTENKVISENKNEHTAKLKEGTLEASKKVSEGLVDLVVDNVKNKTDKDIELSKSKKTTAKDGLSKNNEEIKSKVEVKVTTIKEAVEDIKNEISKINQLEAQESDTVDENMIDENLKSNNISKNTSNQNQIVQNSQIIKNDTSIDGKTVLLANGFLNSQQKNKETVSLSQVADAKNNIEKNKTLQSVKDSANMLGLKIDKIDVKHTDKNGEVKVDIGDKKNKESQLLMMQNRGLNRLIIDKDSNIHNNQNMISGEQVIETQEEMSSKKEKNVIVNVPQNVVETIQSKIIGAHQKVGSFMSEVARNMYLNYKPPFTSFRMNLNPANLGSIAVVMRASKTDNSVNVSMNMNNSSTMEIFAENKTALQTALQKQLGDGSNVTLNFDMQDSSSNEQFGESNQNNSSGAQYGTSNTSDEPTTAITEEENTEEQTYM